MITMSSGWRPCSRSCCAPAPMSFRIASTCRRAWRSRNMSTWPRPSTARRKQAWGTRFSTDWRARAGPENGRMVAVAGRALPGEFELIARYFAPLAAGAPGALDLTDDVATLEVDPAEELVVKTDAIVAGVHFLPDDPPDLVARKLLRVNLSD